MFTGRPNTWKDPKFLQKLIDEYFKNNDKPTLAGLAYALGVSRSTLYAYEEKDDFSDIIKKSRQRVEKSYEERLIYGTQPTGVIFALKNMGWKDKVETDINSNSLGPIQVVSYNDIKDENKSL